MVRARSKRKKDFDRYQIRLLRRLERRRMFDEAWWDTEKSELVSLDNYPWNKVVRAEVLFNNSGFVSPSLEPAAPVQGAFFK